MVPQHTYMEVERLIANQVERPVYSKVLSAFLYVTSEFDFKSQYQNKN
jgi:hypothetical protein